MPYLHTYALTHIPSMLDRPPTTPTRFLFVLQGRFLKKKFNRTKRFVLFFFLQKLQSKNYITRDAIFFRPPLPLFHIFFNRWPFKRRNQIETSQNPCIHIYIFANFLITSRRVFRARQAEDKTIINSLSRVFIIDKDDAIIIIIIIIISP